MVCLPAPEELDSAPALFRAIPAAEGAFPVLPLGCFPTRVSRIERLLPSSTELWVKHESECSARYGGNKVRKLEFLLGQARAERRRRLVTFGGTGSHHVVATAIHGKREGFDVEAVLFPQPSDEHVRELLLVGQTTGARLVAVRDLVGVLPAFLAARRRSDTLWLAGGGSSPLGTLGWVSGGFEIREQVEEGALPRPDVIYLALGSCGTMAGLSWSLAFEPIDLVGVRVANRPMGGWATRRLLRAVDRLLAPLGVAPRASLARMRFEDRFIGSGYGFPTPASEAAVRLAAGQGLKLEPIYTGKVMAALLADARAGRLEGKRVLFLQSNSLADLAALGAGGTGPEALPPRLRALFGLERWSGASRSARE